MIISREPHKEVRHWVGGKPEDCTGKGCRHCLAKSERSIRYLINVEVEGEEFTLQLPAPAFETLEGLIGVGVSLHGAEVSIERKGLGKDTRYYISLLDEGPEDPEEGDVPTPPPALGAGPDVFLIVAAALRAAADEIESYAGEQNG